MKTIWMLMAMYDGKVIVPAAQVAADFFPHLSTEKFVRKVDAGEIDIPLIRIEDSSKAARGGDLRDLAAYLDKRRDSAVDATDKIHGRR